MSTPLLSVRNLQKYFPTSRNVGFRKEKLQVKAVDGISFDLMKGETLGLVGESGCGKTTAGRTILKLIEPTAGEIVFDGKDITKLRPGLMTPLRAQMQIIFQDPFSALNPRQTVGKIIAAPFEIQKVTPEGGVKKEVAALMERVGLNPEHYNRYPHEFSGGQRQRIGIARAIALKPKLIVADEPVSALDVSIQAQVINLIDDLQKADGISIVFIAHDLSVVQHISDRVAVMYLGSSPPHITHIQLRCYQLFRNQIQDLSEAESESSLKVICLHQLIHQLAVYLILDVGRPKISAVVRPLSY